MQNSLFHYLKCVEIIISTFSARNSFEISLLSPEIVRELFGDFRLIDIFLINYLVFNTGFKNRKINKDFKSLNYLFLFDIKTVHRENNKNG